MRCHRRCARNTFSASSCSCKRYGGSCGSRAAGPPADAYPSLQRLALSTPVSELAWRAGHKPCAAFQHSRTNPRTSSGCCIASAGSAQQPPAPAAHRRLVARSCAPPPGAALSSYRHAARRCRTTARSSSAGAQRSDRSTSCLRSCARAPSRESDTPLAPREARPSAASPRALLTQAALLPESSSSDSSRARAACATAAARAQVPFCVASAERPFCVAAPAPFPRWLRELSSDASASPECARGWAADAPFWLSSCATYRGGGALGALGTPGRLAAAAFTAATVAAGGGRGFNTTQSASARSARSAARAAAAASADMVTGAPARLGSGIAGRAFSSVYETVARCSSACRPSRSIHCATDPQYSTRERFACKYVNLATQP